MPYQCAAGLPVLALRYAIAMYRSMSRSPFIYVNPGRESSTRRRGPRPAANITSQSVDIDITLMRRYYWTEERDALLLAPANASSRPVSHCRLLL